jgi:arylsulfatase A
MAYTFGSIISVALILIGCVSSQVSAKRQRDLPNIILIMADDLGYECLSSNGSTAYETPELDALAAKGMRFTQCYSQPCARLRASRS